MRRDKGKNKNKNDKNIEIDITEINDEILEELDKDDDFKAQIEVAKRAVKEVASTSHSNIDDDIEVEDTVVQKGNVNELRYFDNGPSREQIIDYFEKENISFSRTQIDKLFDTKEEIDRLRIDNKRLEKEKSELEFLLRKMDGDYSSNLESVASLKETVELQNTEISRLEGVINNKELELRNLTSSLTDKNKELVDKVISDYNDAISDKDAEIINLQTELSSYKSNSDIRNYRETLLRLKQIEAITEELLNTVIKYPKVYEEYKETIVRVAKDIRNIKV